MSENFQLLYPTYPYKPTQGFGDSFVCLNPFTREIVPKVQGVCPPKHLDFYRSQGLNGHNGVDIAAVIDAEVFHAGPKGIVTEVSADRHRGLGVCIRTLEPVKHAFGVSHVVIKYWHLNKFIVNVGDIVVRAGLVGNAGMTGAATGVHVHLEVKPVAQKEDGTWYNLLQDNGYKGAIDPVPYFIGHYCRTYSLFQRCLYKFLT